MEIAETRKENVSEYQKSQNVRLVDVFVIAPILIYAGVKYRKIMPQWLAGSLILIGACTAIYNGKNYLVNKNQNNKV